MSRASPSVKQFQPLIDASPNGVIALDPAGRIVALNSRMAQKFGYSQQELLGQPFDMLVPERFRQWHAVLVKDFFARPTPRPMGRGRDLVGLHKSGIEIPVEIGLNQVTTREGSLVIATVVDIFDRIRAEREEDLLARAQAQIQVCETLGVPAAVIQPDRRILLVNACFEKIRSQFVIMGERMGFLHTIATRRFMQALARFETNIDENAKLDFSIPAHNGCPPAIVRLLPIFGSRQNPFPIRPLILLILKAARTVQMSSIDLIKESFGLTSAEAKVAVHCAAGFRVQQVAQRLSVSKETVRTELAHIFAKTGVSTQSQLAALLAMFLIN